MDGPVDDDLLAAVTDAALGAAAGAGASNATVRVERIRSQLLVLRDGRPETAIDDTEVGTGVAVVHDGSFGFAGSVAVAADSAAELARQAVDAARVTAPARKGPVTLADEPSHGRVEWTSPYGVDPVEVPLAGKVDLLADWSRRVLAAPGVDHVTAYVMAVREDKYLADLSGTVALQRRVRIHPQLEALSVSDDGDVELDALEEQVGRGLGWSAREIEVPAGRYEVVLPPSAVADLMIYLVEAASGRESEDGRTVFSAAGGETRIGETLTPLPFSLSSDPAHPGLECEPFLATSASSADVSVFDNGLPLARTDWVHDGTLERLRYHRAGAARSGAVPTAPVDNVVLALPGATGTLDDLVGTTERGLLLTSLWYIREVDPRTLLLTGLTRDGVYVVEDGRVAGAANNFRFNESPVDVLARATQASATVRTYGREAGSWVNRTAMPALRVPDWNMSTVSQAV